METPQQVLGDLGEPANAIYDLDEDSSPPPHKRARLDTPDLFDCPICCDTPPTQATFKMRCSHRFCKECWKDYVTAKVKDEGQAFFRCMQDGCVTVVDETSIRRLAVPAAILERFVAMSSSCDLRFDVELLVCNRYREMIRRSFVQSSTDYKFCPHPGCSETIFCPGGRGESLLTEVPTVHCAKEHSFCFACSGEDHKPLICKFIAIWNKTARDDAGTSQWLKANTRACPKCENNIEKNGGCKCVFLRISSDKSDGPPVWLAEFSVDTVNTNSVGCACKTGTYMDTTVQLAMLSRNLNQTKSRIKQSRILSVGFSTLIALIIMNSLRNWTESSLRRSKKE